MGKRLIGYNDWNTVVETAEANIDILIGNKIKAEVGLMSEQSILDYAIKERDKFPKPEEEEKEDIS